jgi:hypothetical protein
VDPDPRSLKAPKRKIRIYRVFPDYFFKFIVIKKLERQDTDPG